MENCKTYIGEEKKDFKPVMKTIEHKRKQRQKDKDDPARKNRKLDTLYMFGYVSIAIVLDNDGKIWFKGVDLAHALEYKDRNNAVYKFMDTKYTKSFDNLNVTSHDISGMCPTTTFVNEVGMNMFVMRSHKPKAEAFIDWFCDEVLPSIRQTGRCEIKKSEENPYKELSDFYKRRITEIEELLKEKDSMLKEKEITIKEKDSVINSKDNQLFKTINKLFAIQPTCVPPLMNELKCEYIMIVRTLSTDNIKFPYYVFRRQESSLSDAYDGLQTKYPLMILKLATPNSVNFFNFILEKISDQIVRCRVNMFNLASGVTEKDFVRNVKNLYRTTYGTDID